MLRYTHFACLVVNNAVKSAILRQSQRPSTDLKVKPLGAQNNYYFTNFLLN